MPQNSLLDTTKKNWQRSELDEYLKAKERTNQNMPKSLFHIEIPQTCPLCHLHLPLKAPLICPHLRARLRIKYALEKTQAMSMPPLNCPLCCPTFPGCICKPKANKPVHFSSLKIYRIPKQRTTTLGTNPLVIKNKCKRMEVVATPERLPVWESAMSTTQDSPGSKRSKGTAPSTSQGKITNSTMPSTCALGSWTENRPSGEWMEGQGRWLSTQNPSQLNDPRFPLARLLTTETSAASTSTSYSQGGSSGPSKSWATLVSSPMYIDSNAVQSKSDSWRSTRGYWTNSI